MRTLVRSLVLNVVVIYSAAYLVDGFSFNDNYGVLLFSAVIFGLVNSFIKPFLKIIFLPFNILTLNLLSWLVNVILLYITTILVEGLTVTSFFFNGGSFAGVTIAPLDIPVMGTYIVTAFIISIINSVIDWIFR